VTATQTAKSGGLIVITVEGPEKGETGMPVRSVIAKVARMSALTEKEWQELHKELRKIAEKSWREKADENRELEIVSPVEIIPEDGLR
jgi:hypothetical protein